MRFVTLTNPIEVNKHAINTNNMESDYVVSNSQASHIESR